MVVQRTTDNVVFASMGNHVFAAICLRLVAFEVDGASHFRFDASHKECEFVYVTDPREWDVIPYTATRLQDFGLVLQQAGDALPLMRHVLRQKEHTLTEDDIKYCANALQLIPDTEPDHSDTLSGTFTAIAKHFCGTDDGEAEAVIAEVELYQRAFGTKLNESEISEQLLDDPLLDAVYEDMDDEDKGEYRELGEAKQRRKYRARVRTWQANSEEPLKKRRRLMRPKGRAKGKAKAAPKANEAAAEPEPAPLAAAKAAPKAKAAAQPAPLAAAADTRPPHIRAASYGITTGWEDIYCDRCRHLAGQKKYSPCPGFRDQPTWYWRAFDYHRNRWPTKVAEGKGSKTVKMMPAEGPDRFIKDEVMSCRSCCDEFHQ